MTLQYVDKMVLIPIKDWEKVSKTFNAKLQSQSEQEENNGVIMSKNEIKGENSDKIQVVKKKRKVDIISVGESDAKEKVHLIPWITLTSDLT